MSQKKRKKNYISLTLLLLEICKSLNKIISQNNKMVVIRRLIYDHKATVMYKATDNKYENLKVPCINVIHNFVP